MMNGQQTLALGGLYTLNEKDTVIENNESRQVSVKNVYYFNDDGEMVTGFVKTAEGKTYFFENAKTKDEGRMVVGWKKIYNSWYFFNPDGTMFTNGTTPDGYNIGADGKMK